MRNKQSFIYGEADSFFTRNSGKEMGHIEHQIHKMLCDWLSPFKSQISRILEIGCANGEKLNLLARCLDAEGFGLEPSKEAIADAQNKFPSLVIENGFGDDLPFNSAFDQVHLGFFLYLVDRELYLRCIAETDRVLKVGGFLSIVDFDVPTPYAKQYKHKSGVTCYKRNNSDVFIESGLYTLVNKYQFSDDFLHFDKRVDERMSLALLYKETFV